MPRISLLVSSYKGYEYIVPFIQNMKSILEECDAEIIHILNKYDATQDKAWQITKAKAKIGENYKITEVNRESLYASWNRAQRLSTSRLVAIQNIDDYRDPGALCQIIDTMNSYNHPCLFGTSFKVDNGYKTYCPKQVYQYSFNDALISMIAGPFFSWIKPSSMGLDDIYFDPRLSVAGDMDFQMRFAALYEYSQLNVLAGTYSDCREGLSTSSKSYLQALEGQLIYWKYGINSKALPFSHTCIKPLLHMHPSHKYLLSYLDDDRVNGVIEARRLIQKNGENMRMFPRIRRIKTTLSLTTRIALNLIRVTASGLYSRFAKNIKSRLITFEWFLTSQIGISPRQIFNSIPRLISFIKDYKSFTSHRKDKRIPIALKPCLHDKFDQSGAIEHEYFVQDYLAAHLILNEPPCKHLDVGSRIDGFVLAVASTRNVDIVDVRPLKSIIPNITFIQKDLSVSPLEQKYDLITCLHALEHFGLGRYGDKIDENSFYLGIKNIALSLRQKGDAIISIPVGENRIWFNSHRVVDYMQFLDIAQSCGLSYTSSYWISSEGWNNIEPRDVLDLVLPPCGYNLILTRFRKSP